MCLPSGIYLYLWNILFYNKFAVCSVNLRGDKTTKTTVNPVYNGHSQIGKTKIFKKNGSLMKVESIAEFSP